MRPIHSFAARSSWFKAEEPVASGENGLDLPRVVNSTG
jgi:hypothetical protein